MEENDPYFKEKVKNSFKNVKEDIFRLDNDLKIINNELKEIKGNISSLKEEIGKILPHLEKISTKSTEIISDVSTGNEGVFNKQTNKQTNKQLNTQQLNTITELQNDIKYQFKTLTKQEFLTFLTIYQLEEELEIVRFSNVAHRLKLTEASIRGYVARLIEKNMPLAKTKINNRVVNLSLLPEFRKLDLKKSLTNMYYNLDPLQKNLSDRY